MPHPFTGCCSAQCAVILHGSVAPLKILVSCAGKDDDKDSDYEDSAEDDDDGEDHDDDASDSDYM